MTCMAEMAALIGETLEMAKINHVERGFMLEILKSVRARGQWCRLAAVASEKRSIWELR